jgi:hypothetical protein
MRMFNSVNFFHKGEGKGRRAAELAQNRMTPQPADSQPLRAL